MLIILDLNIGTRNIFFIVDNKRKINFVVLYECYEYKQSICNNEIQYLYVL